VEAVGATAPLISVRVTGLGRAHGIDEVVQVTVVKPAGSGPLLELGPELLGLLRGPLGLSRQQQGLKGGNALLKAGHVLNLAPLARYRAAAVYGHGDVLRVQCPA